MSFKNGPVAEYIDGFWKLFASIQLTGVILFSLAIFSAVGTFIPQNKDAEQYLIAFGDFLFRLFAVLDLFDMYHAWWFQALLILLTVNIIVCSIDRLTATWKIIFPKERHFSTTRFRELKHNFQFDSSTASDDLKSSFSNALGKSFGYMKLEDTPNGFLIFAEKGRWTRLGVYAVHLSVLLLLFGGLIGSFFGFEGFVTIPEGDSVDRIQVFRTGETRKLDFTVRCDDFNLTLYPNGTPKEFRSRLTILENDKPVLSKDIIVNDPLRYKKISFFQSSYGEMAPESSNSTPKASPSKVILNLTSNESNMSYQREAAIGKSLNLPEGLGELELTEYMANTKFGGQDLGPVIIGTLKPAAGEPKKIVLPLNFPNFDKMRQGKIFISVIDQQTDSKVADSPEQIRYYTGLQVAYDPGVWVVYIGFIMMIIGCYIAFFTSHQQVFIEISTKDNTQHVFLSGISNKDKIGMKRKISNLTERLAKLAG
jgi:cytochrome c biogenesis protein